MYFLFLRASSSLLSVIAMGWALQLIISWFFFFPHSFFSSGDNGQCVRWLGVL